MSKNTFFTGQPVFCQLLNLISRSELDFIASKHGSNRYYKSFFAYDHLVTMLYSSFFQCTSLREITTGLLANSTRLMHLGLKQPPKKSTLSEANQNRSHKFFEDLYHSLYRTHFNLPDSRRYSEDERRTFIIDSTTISLFTSIMHGAGGFGANGQKKGGAKAHMMIDSQHDLPAFVSITESKEHDLIFLQQLNVPENSTVIMDKAYINYNQFKKWDKNNIRWVTRLKNDASIEIKMNLPLSEESVNLGVMEDKIGILGRHSNRKQTAMIRARIVCFYDYGKDRTFEFVTNDFVSSPEHIAELYKKRWQIEMLFKRIKQRYPLKYFLGDNANAIKIQIWSALICDLLVKIVQKKVNKNKKRICAYTTVATMIKHHLMTYIDLVSFLKDPDKIMKTYKPRSNQLEMFYMGLDLENIAFKT